MVSTMLGLELRSVLAAKKTSATLWCRIISRIMVQAQKVPLRPPPFLTHTHAHTVQECEGDASNLIKTCGQTASLGWEGPRGGKCHSLTEQQIKSAVRKKAKWQKLKMKS